MISAQGKNRDYYRLLVSTFILTCLCGSIFAQTFQYSRGWTNGKKRSSLGSLVIRDSNEGPEIFGICQMQRLKEIWENRRLDRDYLPCEMIGKPEIEKRDCDLNSILDSFTHQPN